MEPITIMLFTFGLISTGSVDLVMDDNIMIDGFIYQNDRVIELDTWQTTKNPNKYFGHTSNGDSFYMLLSSDRVFLKIWTESETIRVIEQYQ